jgi:transcriptional regulator with XRE-family HTH domain
MDEEEHAQYMQRVRKLGPLLEERRVAMEISQREMSRRTGMAQSVISRLESGNYDMDLALRYLQAIATGYGIPALELIEFVFPGLLHGSPASSTPQPELPTTELRPTKAYERSILALKEQIASSRRETQRQLQELQAGQQELAQQVELLLSEVRGLTGQLDAVLHEDDRQAQDASPPHAGPFSELPETPPLRRVQSRK